MLSHVVLRTYILVDYRTLCIILETPRGLVTWRCWNHHPDSTSPPSYLVLVAWLVFGIKQRIGCAGSTLPKQWFLPESSLLSGTWFWHLLGTVQSWEAVKSCLMLPGCILLFLGLRPLKEHRNSMNCLSLSLNSSC